MKASQKNTPQKYENWRILPELHHEIGIVAKTQKVPMYELAERAWRAYTSTEKHIPPGPPQPEPLTLTPDQSAMVAALLRFLRDEKPGETYEQFLKGHKQTLESVLKPWMKNISKPKTSKGKKSESAA